MAEAVFRSSVNLSKFQSEDYVICPGNGEIALFQRNDFQALLAIQLATKEQLSVLFSNIYDTRFRSSQRIVFINFYNQDRLNSFSLQFNEQNNFEHFLDVLYRLNFEASIKKKATGDDLFEINQIKSSCSLDREVIPERNDEPFFVQDKIHLKHEEDSGKNILFTTAPKHKSSLVIRQYKDHSDLGLFDLNPNCTFRKSVENLQSSNRSLEISNILLLNGEDSLLLLIGKMENKFMILI
jgi:hypothetical protein